MSFFKITFTRVFNTSLIISLAIYIPLSFILSVVGVDEKSKSGQQKPKLIEATLKPQKIPAIIVK